MTNDPDPLPAWAVAAGFQPAPTHLTGGPPAGAFDAVAIGTMYDRRDGDVHEFLLQVRRHHVNTANIAHGGMLAGLTDVTCSRTLWDYSGRPRQAFITVSLTQEFVGPAPLGCWLLTRCRIRRQGGSIVFIDCEMSVDENLVGLSRCVMKKIKLRQADDGRPTA